MLLLSVGSLDAFVALTARDRATAMRCVCAELDEAPDGRAEGMPEAQDGAACEHLRELLPPERDGGLLTNRAMRA